MAAPMSVAVAVSALTLCMAIQAARAQDFCSSSLNISGKASNASTNLTYSIATSAFNFTRNSRINVTIQGTFENFLLLTRDVSSMLPVGTFEKLPANTTFPANCSTNTTVTKGDAAGNLTNATFTWVAPPASSASSVVFVATIVQSKGVWVGNVESAPIKTAGYNQTPITAVTTSPTSTTSTASTAGTTGTTITTSTTSSTSTASTASTADTTTTTITTSTASTASTASSESTKSAASSASTASTASIASTTGATTTTSTTSITNTTSTASSSAGTATAKGAAMASRSLAPVPWCSLLLTLLFARALAVVATSG